MRASAASRPPLPHTSAMRTSPPRQASARADNVERPATNAATPAAASAAPANHRCRTRAGSRASALSSSAIDGKRSVGYGAAPRSITACSQRGVPPGHSFSASPSAVQNPYWSAAAVISPPTTCSGAMYFGVPAPALCNVCGRSGSVASHARPKSTTRTRPSVAHDRVFRLEVAMHEPRLVRGRQRLARLAVRLDDLAHRPPAHPPPQRPPEHQLHHDVEVLAREPDVVDGNDVGM